MKALLYLSAFMMLTIGAQAQKAQWAKQIGDLTGNVQAYGMQIKKDAQGNIIAAGMYEGTVDLDPGPGVYNVTSPNGGSDQDIFIVKLDAQGNFIWGRHVENTQDVTLHHLEADINGDVVIVSSIQFGFAGLLQKWDKSGNLLWTKWNNNYRSFWHMTTDQSANVWVVNDHFPDRLVIEQRSPNGTVMNTIEWHRGSSQQFSGNLHIDPSGNLFLTGYYEGSMDFDPGPGFHYLTAFSTQNSFVMKLDGSGNLLWVKTVESLPNDYNIAEGAKMDAAGNIYVIGGHSGITDFDPGTGTYYDTAANNNNTAYILKLDPTGAFNWVRLYPDQSGSTALSDYEVTPAGDVYLTGWFTGNTEFNGKFGPSVTLNAQNNHSFLSKLSTTGRLVWVKEMFSPSLYTNRGFGLLLGASGELLVSGIFTDQLQTDPGDPNTLTMTAHPAKESVYLISRKIAGCEVDTSVSRTNNQFSANILAATYQWKDCNTGMDIPGANGQTYTPTQNGDYKVVITEGGCVDSSTCYSVRGIGISDPHSTRLVTAYPNPATGAVTLSLDRVYETIRMEVRSLTGQLVHTQAYKDAQQLTTKLDGPAGVYSIRLMLDDAQEASVHVVKQ